MTNIATTAAPTLEELHETVMGVFRRDPAARAAQLKIAQVEPDAVTLSQTVRPDMLNGAKVLHGGHMFLLADTAFAYRMSFTGSDYLSRSAEIIFVAPVLEGTVIRARATVRTEFGRNVVCDVQVRDQAEKVVAEIRVNGVAVRS